MAHLQNAMNHILRDFVLEKIISFVDDISIKDCKEEAKDLTIDEDGCKMFVMNYIVDIEKILERLGKIDLTLSIHNSRFDIDEIIVVGHFYRRYGKKSNLKKVNTIAKMKACSSITKEKRVLRAYVFYQI